jgi:UPF0271 protein
MMKKTIDLNCDMGEGYGTDPLIMPFISSVNIACGSHAGDEETIKNTIKLAMQFDVAIGAHPSYPDRENFGRKSMEINEEALSSSIIEQIMLVKSIAENMGTRLKHIKPHGALYNRSATDEKVATIIAKAIKKVDENLYLYGLPNSESEQAANREGLIFCREGFADRTYQSNGSLTPRTEKNAMIEDIDLALYQVIDMINQNKVKPISGDVIPIQIETVCIHGDADKALEFATQINLGLIKNQILISSIR